MENFLGEDSVADSFIKSLAFVVSAKMYKSITEEELVGTCWLATPVRESSLFPSWESLCAAVRRKGDSVN